jgi:hypothetical protein
MSYSFLWDGGRRPPFTGRPSLTSLEAPFRGRNGLAKLENGLGLRRNANNLS